MGRTSKGALIVAFLFGLPFGGAGLVALSIGLRKMAEGDARAIVAVMVGAVFTLVGAGIASVAIIGAKKYRVIQRLKAEHPAEPWMWREDWAQGRAASKTGAALATSWLMAVFWNAISFPSALLIPHEQFQRKPGTYVILIFPAIGVGLLVWAVRTTMARFTFGKTWMDLATVPCVIGRELRGTIHARLPRVPEEGITLKLKCVSRAANGDDAIVNVRWEEEKQLAQAEVYAGPQGFDIPVVFHIPLEALPSDESNPANQIAWLVGADASVPGVNYRDLFEVPVFRTKDTPEHEEQSVFAAQERPAPKPVHASVLVRTGEEGGTGFYFPPARNIGYAAGLSAFTVLWTGLTVGMRALGAPLIFPIFFGLFDVLLIWGCGDLWFGTSFVNIQCGSIRVKKGWFGGGKVRTFAASEVAEIRTNLTSQHGGSGPGTAYYSLRLIPAGGRPVALGDNLRSKPEAEWLAAEMRRLLGIKPKAMAAAAGEDPAVALANFLKSFRK